MVQRCLQSGSGEVRSQLGVDHFLHSHVSSLACGWKITSSGSVFSLISCESENATTLLSPPGFHTSNIPQRSLTCFGDLSQEWQLYLMMVLLRRKVSSYSKFPTDDEHVNVVQELHSLPHISGSGCCPNNLSSLNRFNPGFHLCFQEADRKGCDGFSICSMLPRLCSGSKVALLCVFASFVPGAQIKLTREHHVYVLLLLISL